MSMHVCNFKIAVLRCNFVTRQCLTVMIKNRLGSSTRRVRVCWVKIWPWAGHAWWYEHWSGNDLIANLCMGWSKAETPREAQGFSCCDTVSEEGL